jgi:endonuclease/exonuclease/phosphatase family metal-dependent hydrolase
LARTLGAEGDNPWLSAMTFTPYVALGSLVPVIVAAVLRRWVVTGVAVAVVVLFAWSVLPRTFADDAPSGTDGGRPLTVMSLNTNDGRASATRIMDLARRHKVDIVFLQELKPDGLSRLEKSGSRAAFPSRVYRRRARAGGSALFARDEVELGPIGAAVSPAHPVARTSSLTRLPLLVELVHPPHPTSDEELALWRETLERLPSAEKDSLRILAGDFNATLDHHDLRRVIDRGYDDAADAAGEGLRSTWPVDRRRPPVAIDHVLVDERIAVRSFSTHEVPGSDHRAIVAQLTLPR